MKDGMGYSSLLLAYNEKKTERNGLYEIMLIAL